METMTDICKLSEKFGIRAEYKQEGGFPAFLSRMQGKDVMVLCDLNTQKYALPMLASLRAAGVTARLFVLEEREPVADEEYNKL